MSKKAVLTASNLTNHLNSINSIPYTISPITITGPYTTNSAMIGNTAIGTINNTAGGSSVGGNYDDTDNKKYAINLEVYRELEPALQILVDKLLDKLLTTSNNVSSSFNMAKDTLLIYGIIAEKETVARHHKLDEILKKTE